MKKRKRRNQFRVIKRRCTKSYGPDNHRLLNGCSLSVLAHNREIRKLDKEFERMSYKQAAYARGEDEAIKAASWVIDGNTPQDHIRRMVKWMDDGDPLYEQYLPARPNLSGEWADDLTDVKLMEEIVGYDESNWVGLKYRGTLTINELLEEISEAFAEGVADHFEPECERILRAALAEDE